MKMNRILIFSAAFFLILLTSSCFKSEKEGDGLPYYKFTESDRFNLLNPVTIDDEIVYRNQDNETITFKINESHVDKQVYGVGTFWGNVVTNYFYYDQQGTSMWYVEGYEFTACKVTLLRYPKGSNYLIQNPVTGTPAFFGLLDFPLWNGYNGEIIYSNSIHLDYPAPTFSMTFNGKTFSKVRLLESNNTEILEPNNTPPFYTRNVHRIYFDEDYGVIGFDDLNGKEWRVI